MKKSEGRVCSTNAPKRMRQTRNGAFRERTLLAIAAPGVAQNAEEAIDIMLGVFGVKK